MLGIIPAGGNATRIHGVPKWLLPTPQGTLIDVLIRRMQLANPREIVVMTKGFNAVLLKHVDLADVTICDHDDSSMAHAVMLAEEHRRNLEFSVFGMPDTYFEDEQAFVKLYDALNDGADVAVGAFLLCPDQQHKIGCLVIEGNRVVRAVDKPASGHYLWGWGVLGWRSQFWWHMRETDPHVGYALPRAIEAGLDVRAVDMEGQYWDCGTFNEYAECIKHFEAVTHGA